MFGFIVFLVIIVIAAIIALIFSYMHWYDNGKRWSFNDYISFSKFIELYNFSPEHWILEDYFVKFRPSTFAYEIYHFQYVDFYKYLWWHAKKIVEEKEIKKKEERRRAEDKIKNIEDIIKGNKE